VKNGQILEGARSGQPFFGNGGCLPDRRDPGRGHFADDPGCESGAREGNAVEGFLRQPQGLAQFSHAVLAELDQGLQDPVPEGFLGIDPQLFKDIVLPFDARHRFIHVGEDGSLEQVACTAVQDDVAEYLFIEGLRNGLSFFLRIGDFP